MKWKTRAEYLAQKHRYGNPLVTRLDACGFDALAPARTIIRQPNDLTKAFMDRGCADFQLLADLMHNFWTYGRTHWSWTSTSPQATVSEALVRGKANYGACGTFNANFAYLAREVLGIPSLKSEQKLDVTSIDGAFVTMPAAMIDSQWLGNVMTESHDFANLSMFKFSGHYFCNFNGVIFDATSNSTFGSVKDMIAFRLSAVSKQDACASHPMGRKVFKVTNVHPNAPWRPGMDLTQGSWFLVQLDTERLIAGNSEKGFPKWLLTQQPWWGFRALQRHSQKCGRTAHTTYDQQRAANL